MKIQQNTPSGFCDSFNCLGHFKNVFDDNDDDEVNVSISVWNSDIIRVSVHITNTKYWCNECREANESEHSEPGHTLLSVHHTQQQPLM